MNIFESLENLQVSEKCFESIIELVEEFINEISKDTADAVSLQRYIDRRDAKEKYEDTKDSKDYEKFCKKNTKSFKNSELRDKWDTMKGIKKGKIKSFMICKIIKNTRRSMSNKYELISKYVLGQFNKREGYKYNSELLSNVEKELEERGYLEEAKEAVLKDIKEDEERKEVKASCTKLAEILEDFNVWKIGKFNKELKEIKDTLREKDSNYAGRITLFEQLMETPKFKELEEHKKIRVAMQLGALDFNELGLKE